MKAHIKNILKEFYRTKPAEGERLDEFLEGYADLILAYMPETKKVSTKFRKDEVNEPAL